MKEFLLLLVVFAIWVATWRLLARHWRSKGWNAVVSHAAAAIVGFVLCIFAAGIILPPSESTQTSEKPAAVTAETEHAASAIVPVETAKASAASSADATTKSHESWPTPATMDVPRLGEEKRYVADQTCLDESECYGPKRFERDIFKRYPDLAKIKYHPLQDEANDADTVAMRREQFVHGLYFAKQIKLANGQTLFDFMTTCATGFNSLDGAESAYDTKTNVSYFDVRYYPTLRRADTGEPVEMQILFERRDDRFVAQSPFFTSNAVRYADFLQRHRLKCWSDQS
ncbi:hypothetical protein [Burkholderia sp. BCC1977]|uniref:hypothetical protein n=1 Tax=Burkholderia sp. BCC1977 TaxID=2817440 RepID=UPI002ABDEA3D|nr:hypothetical protein [Burkholderia sp. BCC1977]